MEWLKETITFAIGVLLGFMSGFVWPRLRDNIAAKKDRKTKAERKARILKDLDAIASDVIEAVLTEPHGVQNKDKWVSRLQQFATQYDDVLGPLAGYVKRISYKIEDSTFDHESLDTPSYCCDQVEEDLVFLKLCILPIVAKALGWDPGMIEKEEKRLLAKAWVNFQEIIPPQLPPGLRAGMTDRELQLAFEGWDGQKAMEEYQTQQVNRWHAEWKAYRFKIGAGENLAMAPYVNHERKGVE